MSRWATLARMARVPVSEPQVSHARDRPAPYVRFGFLGQCVCTADGSHARLDLFKSVHLHMELCPSLPARPVASRGLPSAAARRSTKRRALSGTHDLYSEHGTICAAARAANCAARRSSRKSARRAPHHCYQRRGGGSDLKNSFDSISTVLPLINSLI